MVADIRATTICNLGVVIEGSISDESISPGQGLVRCRGQLVIDGLITPAAGTVVQLAYERDGVITRIPRRLRVVSSFADPFRNLTTVQIGDKLVWLANKGPNKTSALPPQPPEFPEDPEIGDLSTVELPYPQPTTGDPNLSASISYVFNGICWQPQNKGPTNSFKLEFPQVTAEENVPTRPADEQLRAPVTIAGWVIASKCLAGLGLASTGITLIQSHYREEDAVIFNSYASTLETLLSKESLVGFLDANEVLQVKTAVIGSSSGGIYLTEPDIIDISPIGFGEVPAEANELLTGTDTSQEQEPVLDPEPITPVAKDCKLGTRASNTSFFVSYSFFLQNATFDNKSLTFNKIKIDVSADTGCSVEEQPLGVLVELQEDFIGTATLSFSVRDGELTSNTAKVEINVVESTSVQPPDDTPIEGAPGQTLGDLLSPSEGDSSVPPDALAGTEIAYSTGSEQEIVLEYVTLNGNQRNAKYSSFPSTQALVTYGKYGEVLKKTDIKRENGVEAAANVFLLWLKYGEAPPNIEVYSISVTDYYYDYSFEENQKTNTPPTSPSLVDTYFNKSPSQTTESSSISPVNSLFPQSSQCTIGKQCEPGITLPDNPEEGDIYKFGDCQYKYDETSNRWQPFDGEPDEGVTVTTGEPSVPTVEEAQLGSGKNLSPYQTITSTYEHAYYISGSIPWTDLVISSIYLPLGAVSAVPPLEDWDTLTERTIVNYTQYVNETNQTVSQEDTKVFKARYKTIEGQQFLATLVNSIPDLMEFSGLPGPESFYDRVFHYALELIEDNANSSVRVGRVSNDETSNLRSSVTTDPAGNVTAVQGSQDDLQIPNLRLAKAKSVLPRIWDSESGYREVRDESATIEIKSEIDPETEEPVEITVPSRKEQNEDTLLQKRFELRRAIQWGTRYGLALQVTPWSLPSYPMSPIYINLRSVVGAFRANAISIAFSNDGILANCDALLVGGVGGTGTPWFPLPEGTELPEAPEPVIDGEAVYANSIATPEGFDPNSPSAIFDSLPTTEIDSFTATLTPDAIVLSDPPSYRIAAGVRVGMAFDKVEWSLTPVIKDQALGVKSGIVAVRQTRVKAPTKSITFAAAVPTVSTGIAVSAPTSGVAIAVGVPAVSTGAAVFAPAAGIAVAAGPGPIVPREATVTSVPSSTVAIAAAAPAVVGGASVAVPVAGITVAALAPSLPAPFATVLYTGTGSSLSVTGVGFEPGIVWIKRRTVNTSDHAIYDYVQGTGKYWRSNQSIAQVTDANSLTSFDSDGFTVGTAAISNTNTASYVAWAWPKGGTGTSNSDGSITTTTYTNGTAGYSIFTFTGTGVNATVGHGLGASPELVFMRNLSSNVATAVGGDFLANNEYTFLGTLGKASSATVYQSYSSTTVSIGTNSSVNGNGSSMLGYAFKSVSGNSDIGTYTGTGTTDQSITTGFTPSFVLIKVYSTTGSWMMFDDERGVTKQLNAGENSIETTVDKVTFDASGFTVKANQNTNTNAATYVYMAFR